MLPGLYAALSGMNAATLRAEVAARNIVNAASAGSSPEAAPLASETLAGTQAYQPQKVVQSSLPSGGTSAHTIPVRPSTYPVYDPSNPASDENGMIQYPERLAGSRVRPVDHRRQHLQSQREGSQDPGRDVRRASGPQIVVISGDPPPARIHP